MRSWKQKYSLRSRRHVLRGRGALVSVLGWLAVSVLVVFASRLVGLGALKRGPYRELLRWYAEAHPRQWVSSSLLHGSWTPLFADVVFCWLLAIGARKLREALRSSVLFLRAVLEGTLEMPARIRSGFEPTLFPQPVRSADPQRLWAPGSAGVWRCLES